MRGSIAYTIARMDKADWRKRYGRDENKTIRSACTLDQLPSAYRELKFCNFSISGCRLMSTVHGPLIEVWLAICKYR